MTFFLDIWNLILEFKEHDWAQNVIVLSLFSAFLWLSWRLIVTRLHRIAAKTKLPWDDAVISAISSHFHHLFERGSVDRGLPLS